MEQHDSLKNILSVMTIFLAPSGKEARLPQNSSHETLL
jgi:hypothetical protein